MFCQKCGAEVANDATVCMNCGCPTTSAPTPSVPTKQKKPVSKKIIILSSIGALVLVLAIFVAAVLIRTDIKLNDLTAKPNRVTALLQFGLPRDLNSDSWTYQDCITFHSIKVDHFSVDFDEGSYSILEFDGSDQEDLAEVLIDFCSLDRSNGVYYYFTFDNLEITADGDCLWIDIEVSN